MATTSLVSLKSPAWFGEISLFWGVSTQCSLLKSTFFGPFLLRKRWCQSSRKGIIIWNLRKYGSNCSWWMVNKWKTSTRSIFGIPQKIKTFAGSGYVPSIAKKLERKGFKTFWFFSIDYPLNHWLNYQGWGWLNSVVNMFQSLGRSIAPKGRWNVCGLIITSCSPLNCNWIDIPHVHSRPNICCW